MHESGLRPVRQLIRFRHVEREHGDMGSTPRLHDAMQNGRCSTFVLLPRVYPARRGVCAEMGSQRRIVASPCA